MEKFILGPEVKSLLIDFYLISGVRIGIYDSDELLIDEYPRTSENFGGLSFCEQCKLCSENWCDQCAKSDRDAFDIVRISEKTYVYECAKGFLEAIVPIRLSDEVRLYLMIGQIRQPDASPDSGKVLFRKYACEPRENFTEEDAQAAYERMRCLDQKSFHAMVRVLEICAQKICTDEYVRKAGRSVSVGVSRYVSANLYNDISVNDAAASLNYSVSYLSHSIAKEMGTTFIKYVNSCRIAEAKRLLRLTNMNVERIASLLRYNGTAYFVRQFKKETGMTCTEYRELRGSPKRKPR